MARVLAFRHNPAVNLGWIADALNARRMAWEYVDLFQSPDVGVQLREGDILISLGGSMSANDDLPYIRRELAIITEAIERGVPILGVCLGAQMIAKALGARVCSNPVKEIGWAPITFTEAAASDPLFSGVSGSEIVFHWHQETFELPPDAALLALSANCRNQAFRWRDHVYGLQFHLEVTPAMIGQWVSEDAACSDDRETLDLIDPHAHGARAKALADVVFGRWCDFVKELAEASGSGSQFRRTSV